MLSNQSPEQKDGLARRLGTLSVIGFGITNQVGSGLFFISTQIQETAPGVGDLVPWLMVIGALTTLLIVVIYRFFFAQGLVGAGGEYLMMSRVLGKRYAFVITFLAWFGLSGSMSLLAYVTPRFLADVCLSLDVTSWAHYLSSSDGTLITGLIILWGVWFVHVRGVKLAGTFVVASMFIVIFVTLVVIVYGFSTTPEVLEAAVVAKTGIPSAHIVAASPVQRLSPYAAFVTALPILYFGYIGLSTATQTGDEARNAKSSLAAAVLITVLVVGTLYTLFTFAIYHAAHWQLISGLAALNMSAYTTSTGLLGVVMPRWVSAIVNLGVAFIMMKTVLPIYMAQSRWIYAWSQDGVIPKVFSRLHAKHRTPVVALTISAVLGSFGLVETIKVGYVFGVNIRVIGVMLVFISLGLSVILFPKLVSRRDWNSDSWFSRRRNLQLLVAGVVIALSLWFGVSIVISSVHGPVMLQPWFQLLVAVAVGFVILWATSRFRRQRGDG